MAARHLRVPGIVLLLAIGVLLGPDVVGIVRPGALGEGLQTIVGMAVAVILFEGGLALNVGRLRRQARTIRQLVTVGALVTAVAATLLPMLLLHWDWRTAVLFGSLVIVTGPTVVQPLLRRIRVKSRLATILEAEAVFIDPIGAILAVVAFRFIVVDPQAAAGLLDFASRLGTGTLIGAAGGYLIGRLLQSERLIPEGLENVVTLALVLALFEVSDAVRPETGILAVAIAGLVVGNMETRVSRELREFKESLTVLLVGLLFVLLAADVRIREITDLGWEGMLVVLVLMLVVRPLCVAVSTIGSDLDRKDRLFLSWLAPRGIVAAAVASLFAQSLTRAGVEGGTELRALVFLLIAVTVSVQGVSGGAVASLLGVRRPEDRGYIIVGANAVGRALGGALRDAGEEVVLIDSNAAEAQQAEAEGFKVAFGNARKDRTLLQADVEGRRGFIALTPNDAVNLLLARDAAERFSIVTYVMSDTREVSVETEQVRAAGAGVLFGSQVDIELWNQRIRREEVIIEPWTYAGEEGLILEHTAQMGQGITEEVVLPLTLTRGKRVRPVDDRLRLRHGDVVVFAWPKARADMAYGWLIDRGWRQV